MQEVVVTVGGVRRQTTLRTIVIIDSEGGLLWLSLCKNSSSNVITLQNDKYLLRLLAKKLQFIYCCFVN